MGLNSYAAKEPRPLPIFILADTSGSMMGEKVNELNLALREMLNALKNADEIRGMFKLCIITFGGKVDIPQPISDVDHITLPELSASGNTPMGDAFNHVRDLIENRDIVSSRAYTPTIVLISDGLPTDCPEEICRGRNYSEWEPLKALQNGGRSSKCQRLALGIGNDADTEMLRAFINNPEVPLIRTGDASGITKFFKWVTMSTIARMHSVNPNDTASVLPVFDIDSEDIII